MEHRIDYLNKDAHTMWWRPQHEWMFPLHTLGPAECFSLYLALLSPN